MHQTSLDGRDKALLIGPETYASFRYSCEPFHPAYHSKVAEHMELLYGMPIPHISDLVVQRIRDP